MSDIDNNENILRLLEIRLLQFLFTIPLEVVFKDLSYFLGANNLKYLLKYFKIEVGNRAYTEIKLFVA